MANNNNRNSSNKSNYERNKRSNSVQKGRRSSGKTKTEYYDAGEQNSAYEEDVNKRKRPSKYGKGPHSNDVAWYAQSTQLLSDSSSFSYGYPTGIQMDLTTAQMTTPLNWAIPGVMSFSVQGMFGISKDYSSPLNVAGRNIYSFVRYANSGSRNYEAPDLLLYFLAMDQIYSALAHLIRTYGIARLYSQENRYYPVALLKASGFDADDVISNLSNLRYAINTLIFRAGSFCVPSGFSIYLRHYFMFSNVYMDSVDVKAQSYIFKPHGFYWYEELAQSTGGSLGFVPWALESTYPNGYKVSDAINYVRGMIDRMGLSEDMNIMSGDILKAYGENNLFKLATISDDYTVVPVYDQEVLDQIHNSMFLDSSLSFVTTSGHTPAITQDPDTQALIFDPYLSDGSTTIGSSATYMPCGKIMMSFDHNDVTPADSMTGSRLAFHLVQNSDGTYAFDALGSEIIRYVRVWAYNYANSTPELQHFDLSAHRSVSSSTTGLQLMIWLPHILSVSQFRKHPKLWVRDNVSAKTQFLLPLWDVNRWTIITAEALRNMHETALLSMFNVPQFGKMS